MCLIVIKLEALENFSSELKSKDKRWASRFSAACIRVEILKIDGHPL